jgi:hypothetical protein
MSILRIELRRSMAPLAWLVLAATGIFVLFVADEPYGSWMQMATTQRDIMQLTWSLALAAGAWQGTRERRSRVEELIATTSRPRWQRVLPVSIAMAVAVAAAYLITFAGAAAHLLHPDVYFSYGVIPMVAVGALGFVAAVWLGLALGTLLPSPLTAPILAVAGFLVTTLLPVALFDQRRGRPGIMLLFPSLQGPRSPDLPDGGALVYQLSTRAHLTQALWLAAIAVTGLLLFAGAGVAARIAALLPLVLGAALAIPAMPANIADAWVDDGRATELVCAAGVPRICVVRVEARLLDDLLEPARHALAVLAAKAPPAPTQVRAVLGEKSGDEPVPADTLVVRLSLFEEDVAEYTAADLEARMLEGAGVRSCLAMSGRPGPQEEPTDAVLRYIGARAAVTLWVTDRQVGPSQGKAVPEDEYARQALDALRALPEPEQRARIEAFRTLERTCAPGDRLAVLAPESAAK